MITEAKEMIGNAKWYLGYSNKSLVPDDVTNGEYYIGGYIAIENGFSNVVEGIAEIPGIGKDDMKVRCVAINDGTGNGTALFATIDCIGITNADIKFVNDEDKLIGYGRLLGDKTIFLYIHSVMFLPEYQGKHIAKSLMLEHLKEAKLKYNVNVIEFIPMQVYLFKDSPKDRRKFLDILISQLKPNYMYNLNLYLKTLEQRNNYLKQIKLENKSADFLDIWDEKLSEYAEKVYNYRLDFINKIKEKIIVVHNTITENKEKINIEYISDFLNRKDFVNKLKNNRQADIIKGYTNKGIHRDDFYMYIDENLINIYGSQGQHRTAILSLKMSELKVICDEIGESPILLLDDFMSELDDKRIKNFLENISDTQVLITGTDKISIENLNFNVYNVKNGKII